MAQSYTNSLNRSITSSTITRPFQEKELQSLDIFWSGTWKWTQHSFDIVSKGGNGFPKVSKDIPHEQMNLRCVFPRHPHPSFPCPFWREAAAQKSHERLRISNYSASKHRRKPEPGGATTWSSTGEFLIKAQLWILHQAENSTQCGSFKRKRQYLTDKPPLPQPTSTIFNPSNGRAVSAFFLSRKPRWAVYNTRLSHHL